MGFVGVLPVTGSQALRPGGYVGFVGGHPVNREPGTKTRMGNEDRNRVN